MDETWSVIPATDYGEYAGTDGEGGEQGRREEEMRYWNETANKLKGFIGGLFSEDERERADSKAALDDAFDFFVRNKDPSVVNVEELGRKVEDGTALYEAVGFYHALGCGVAGAIRGAVDDLAGVDRGAMTSGQEDLDVMAKTGFWGQEVDQIDGRLSSRLESDWIGGVGKVASQYMLSTGVAQERDILLDISRTGGLNVDDVDDAKKQIIGIRRSSGDKLLDGEFVLAMYCLEGLKDELGGESVARGSGGRTAEAGSEIPPTKEGQLAMVRRLLRELEDTGRSSDDFQVGRIATILESLSRNSELKKDVRREVQARLNLNDCAIYMNKAGGWIVPPRNGADPVVPSISAAATLAKGRGHELNRDNIQFLLKDGANDLPIARAWDLIQKANYNYFDLLSEVADFYGLTGEERVDFLGTDLKVFTDDDRSLGKVDTNFYTDPKTDRRSKVRAHLIDSLGDDGDRAFMLAERLTVATMETSVFNRSAMTGNDQPAEIIGLKGWRYARYLKSRESGPQIHLFKIEGFGTSWLRYVSKFGSVDQPFYTRDLRADLIPEGSYTYFFPVLLTAKWNPLKEVLASVDYKPADMVNAKYFRMIVDYFNKADPEGRSELRLWWLLGVLDMAASDSTLGWQSKDFERFVLLATQPLEVDSETISFLDRREVEKKITEYGLRGKMRKMGAKRFFNAILSGGKQ
ncbi:hypothetical protein DRH14_00725 [Candidatus Shapirobacteria bacterium]|nr:MAG: hypothetical protein DRH14_00725 [Candidatus Shapirobacteria bacterium]